MQTMEPRGPRVPYPHPQMPPPSADGLATDAPRWSMTALTPRQVVREHELRRRHRLVRIIALGVMVGAGLLIPSALVPSFNPATLAALVIAFVGTSLAYLLSRSGLVTSAGYAVVLSLVVAIAFEVVGKSIHQGGLDLSDLRILDIFVLPILLSGVLITRRGTILMATLTSTFTIAAQMLLPKTEALQQYWTAQYPVPGSPIDAISVAVVVQGLTAVVAWLGADSVQRALSEATRADEVAAANRALDDHRRRLQAGIARLQQVHAAVATGRWDVRARPDDSELLPLATSLNLLLDRVARLLGEQGQRARVDAAAHTLAEALRRARAGQPFIPAAYTGTAEDEVLVELVTALRDIRDGRVPAQQVLGAIAGPSAVATDSPAGFGGAKGYGMASGMTPPSPPASVQRTPPYIPPYTPHSQPWPPAVEGDPRDSLPDWLRGD